MLTLYEKQVMAELNVWKRRMQRPPSYSDVMARRLQTRINRAIPEQIHKAFTLAVKQMTRAVLFGAGFVNKPPVAGLTLEAREQAVLERIRFYRNTAAAEGAVTGAGGILLGMADFPLWLMLKMKLLFEVAALYGHDTRQLSERLYLLHIFELSFSSPEHRGRVYKLLANWEAHSRTLPDDIHAFDWRTFQQEYRDYLDLAKMLQLVPGIGAAVGAVVNHRLTTRLGKTATNAYRMRWLAAQGPKPRKW